MGAIITKISAQVDRALSWTKCYLFKLGDETTTPAPYLICDDTDDPCKIVWQLFLSQYHPFKIINVKVTLSVCYVFAEPKIKLEEVAFLCKIPQAKPREPDSLR